MSKTRKTYFWQQEKYVTLYLNLLHGTKKFKKKKKKRKKKGEKKEVEEKYLLIALSACRP